MPKGVLQVQNFCFAYYMTISGKNQQFDGKYGVKMTSAVTPGETQIWVNSSSYPLELDSSPWCASCSGSARSAWGGRCRGWIGSRVGPCVRRGSQLLCLILQIAICLRRVFHLSYTKIHMVVIICSCYFPSLSTRALASTKGNGKPHNKPIDLNI